MQRQFKAETFISVIVAILLSSIIFLSYSKWQKHQNKKEVLIYQRLQAMQIAENQLSLKMAKLPCQSSIKQNEITFIVNCRHNEIKVTFPLGEFYLKP
ncbi:DUF5374 domain-containing protein [Pasteurella atlantica]|uniref:DUF5374 domain-containing protein n=1 Tax=Pasteurellaceae TaxID=712 RepID=UPI00275E9765|nr:DUF5374 domain-containing protein [Pasteurella atlantica]MDP8033743.1 DUF5374 domain-containing protein [Pasteurella atlantica]MDP8035678.1 DUF5374 domain-containing protein [Pasteurella atlantica]MDP8037641.1 DUF5374 domain-containing protein [Pasteurella atlantica]MDP8047978.1 DUF5374 domain-containing protein [Pasteurella atlantica]MDP8049933.1 DUF5374 domain-containing protein [Pasteurella atlantica]